MKRLAETVVLGAFVALCLVPGAEAAGWNHPLYLDGGDYWRQRIPVTVSNEADHAMNGDPVALKIGDAVGEAHLTGAAAESVRVCNPQGEEMLFALTDANGSFQTRGAISAGGTLVIPVECAAHKTATCYVYFDNPSAGEVPDFLSARLGVANGDVELGAGVTPTDWKHDVPDAAHRATWSDEQPQSGKRCLKTVVAQGAAPTWISTRQQDIGIRGGAKYVMKAWVRAEDVQGTAGWYIHVGNRQEPMMIAPTLNAGEGTYGWKQVSLEFTAPSEANLASLGTVLRGTGTAWFDHVALECLQATGARAMAGKPERMKILERGAAAAWPGETAAPASAGNWRAAVKVFNFSDQPVAGALASVDLAMLEGRMRGRLNRQSIVVTRGTHVIPHFFCGRLLLFEADSPAQSVETYYVYFRDDAGAVTQSPFGDVALLHSDRNLVKNPGFEAGEKLPEGWTPPAKESSAKGVAFGFDEPGQPGLGRRSAKMCVSEKAAKTWRGWRQDVPVQPGHTYLLAAAVKCEKVRDGEIRVHAHRHQANGQLCQQEPMVGIGPPISGTTGWTLMSGVFTMPSDAAVFSLHLTTQCAGTVWHDAVLVAEVVPAALTGLQSRPAPVSEQVQAWPVPAIVKVFPEDAPPDKVGPARISAARNEKEPLQLAVRSAKVMRGVRVEVEPPVGPQGVTLNDLTVNVVGYVPIDHATSYYQSRTAAWRRKYPRGGAQSDGWPGLWPDPLLPSNTLDLKPGVTQSIWITVAVGKTAPPGDYAGKARLVCDGRELAVMPFSVHVWDFTLPDEGHVKAIYDARLGHGEKHWGKSTAEAYPEIVEFMARRRTCPDMIQPGPVFQYRDGRASADFTAFDKAAERYFRDLRLPHAYMPHHFYLFGWGFPPNDVFGERPYPGERPFDKADRSKLRPEYKKAYQACLRLFWDHVKEKGWHKRFVLYISDEPFYRQEPIRRQMRALCDMIHEVDRQIPIYSSTWHHVPDWDGYLDIWGIGHYGVVSPEKMAQLRAQGAKIWFTTDGQMCTDTPYCAVERLLPHYCFRYGAEAYEFWGAAWLTYDPYRFGWHAYIHQSDAPGKSYWVRYPNGDGFLIYPGAPIGHVGPVSTVRFEQAREGVEDYEYLYLLRQRVDQAKATGKNASQGEGVLEQAAQLVPIPNAGGRYSTKILPDPNAVYDLKEALGKAIERLGR